MPGHFQKRLLYDLDRQASLANVSKVIGIVSNSLFSHMQNLERLLAQGMLKIAADLGKPQAVRYRWSFIDACERSAGDSPQMALFLFFLCHRPLAPV